MNLLSSGTIALVAILAVAAPGVCLFMWNRVGGNRIVRIGVRASLLVTCQLLAVLLAGLVLNKSYDFYTSWSELFGKPSLTTGTTSLGSHSADGPYTARLRAAFYAGHGTVIPWTIPGTSSGLPPLHALVYLPAAYGDPAAPDVRYPVVELMDGVPGTPETWLGPLHLQGLLDAQIASWHALPFIAVLPTQNVLAPRDTQCLNVAGGPNVDTYLTVDVHRAVDTGFRAASDAASWGIMGYSTGGYCALNLAMRHPDLYSSAVSISGYARPDIGASPGNLLHGDAALTDANTPLWEARHWGHRSLTILAIASRHDGPSYRDTIGLDAAARPPLRISDILLAKGGHNAHLWLSLEPVAFNWLSQHLRPPLAGVSIRSDLLPVQPPERVTKLTAGRVHRAPRALPRDVDVPAPSRS
jgi:enterochelin esterase-like enzyme